MISGRVATVGLLALACLVSPSTVRAQGTPRPASDTAGMHGMGGMMMDTAHRSGGRDSSMKMSGMSGMSDGPMTMPIPMPAGMLVMPGLLGLTPPGSVFLPGAGVNTATLPAAQPRAIVRLRDGDTLALTASLVRRTIHGRTVAMYGFNGQIPGPLIRVPQNATITIRFTNRIDLPTAVHWHGVRLDNHSDGVPGVTQPELAPGGSFIYRVHFPDAGLYWYHPHVREDIEQAMGLFGNMIVDSPDKDYYAPANQEQVLMLDDLLINADTLIPFGGAGPDFTLMGRVGNELLVNGDPNYTLSVAAGEVVRFFLTNVSNSRTYNLSFGGAPMKIVASDVSRFEHEERVASVVIAPAERYIVDVRFEHPGRYALINAVQAINHFRGEFAPEVDTMGVVTVGPTPATPDYASQFATLRDNVAVSRDIDRYRSAFDRPPDKTLRLTVQVSGLPLATVQFMTVDTAYFAPIEWVDAMPDMNWLSTNGEVRWILRDESSGKENMDIDWHVRQGSIVKPRIFNDPKSFHPMQHPIHLHGQRMLVIARDSVPTHNLVWKDTVLIPVGSTVDLLIDASNPGTWMLHCHIAEHLHSGMMTSLHVDPAPSPTG
jgi:FtsP/CotA-like multicopper oxidase with cupredoxin domain